MKRTGFWGQSGGEPILPELLIDRKDELTKQLRELYQRERKVSNPEQRLKEYRQQRMKESREKQVATRERREQERSEKSGKMERAESDGDIVFGERHFWGIEQQGKRY